MIKAMSAKKTYGVISLEEQTRAFGRRKGSLIVGRSHSLQWMQRDKNEHEEIANEVIERTDITEIHQIEATPKRISEGTYGTCAKCGKPIDPRRLKTLPIAATCISCSA
jgi:RNA polymerase-binding transcription factor DksA